jgi:hypothetical protein
MGHVRWDFIADRAPAPGTLGYNTEEEATANSLQAIRRVGGGRVYRSERMADSATKQLVSAGRWAESKA